MCLKYVYAWLKDYFKHVLNICFKMCFRYWIRKFGRALNFDTGTHEKFHQTVVVKPFKADARREEGQLDRLYEKTNMSQCLYTFLRSVTPPPELKPTGFSFKDTYPYSFKELEKRSLNEMRKEKDRGGVLNRKQR